MAMDGGDQGFEQRRQALMSRQFSRRQVLRRAGAVGIGIPALVGLLAACGGDDDDAPEATTAATAGSSGQATATATAASTQVSGTTEATATEEATSTAGTPAVVLPVEGTFRFADGSEPNSLDPPIGTGPFGHNILAMFETLTVYDQDLAAGPLLATDWEIGDDNRTWTFNLKEGVKFHDGTEFNSEAVKYTLDRILDEEFGAGRRAVFTVIEEVIADEPYVVQIRTVDLFPDLAFLMADRSACIVSPTAAEEAGPEEFGLHPVGTGPFAFVEWMPNDHISYRRFEDYHGTPAQVSEIIYRVVPEAASREAMLRAGEVDLILTPPIESLDALRGEGDLTVSIYDTLTQATSEFRQTQPPFSHKEVRQAMCYAIDAQAIIDTIMGGLGSIATGPYPSGWGAIQLEPYEYDPEKAKELLASAGYPDGFEGNMSFTPNRWAGDTQAAEALQSYWAQVGVRINIVEQDLATGIAADSLDPDTRPGWTTFQLRTSAYLDYHLYRLFHSSSTFAEAPQRTGYKNERVDELLDAARSTFDEQERLAAYEEAQRLIWDDAPMVVVFVRQQVIAHRATVSGFRPLPISGDIYWNDLVLIA